MNEQEARTVAEIATTADGGCCVCVGALLGRLQVAFPDFEWAELAPATDMYGQDEWRRRVAQWVEDAKYEDEEWAQ